MSIITQEGLEKNKKPYKELKFRSAKTLQESIDGYFAKLEKHIDKHYTITGLALHLETSRENLMLLKESSEYLYRPIQHAFTVIEAYTEERMFDKPELIKILEKNFGW